MDVYAASATVSRHFTTNAATGAAVAPSTAFESADIILYKDASATQRTSQSGWTMTSPFDSITGLHHISFDTSDNTDAGFYAAGSVYTPVLSPDETVDSVTVVAVLEKWKIGTIDVNVTTWLGTAAATPTVAGVPEVDVTHWIGTAAATPTVAGVPEVDVTHWLGTAAATPTVAGVPEVDITHIAGSAVSTSSAQLGVNVVNLAGTAYATAKATFIDEIWDEVNTGATHNVANSTGRQLRQISGQSIALFTGTAQAGASSTITLSAAATSVNNAFVGCTIVITGGTGLFQVRRIIAYNGTTKVATVDRTWGTNPDNTSTFAIYANSNPIISDEGTAQAGGASTITLRSGASATDDIYNNAFVTILSGTGSGQTRIISDYVGATKVATVDSAWDTQPDATSIYAVIPNAQQSPQDNVYTGPSVAEIWSQAMTELTSVPGVSGTALAALSWCFTVARNKRTQTATTETLFKDDGSTTLATSTKSDAAGTFTRGEYA